MFKKTLIVCAGLVLSGQAALAQLNIPNAIEQPVYEEANQAVTTVTYAGEANGKPLIMQVVSHAGEAAGKIYLGESQFTFSGRDQAGNIEGAWGASSGQRFPFQAVIRNGQMRLTTNGQTYTLNAKNPLGSDTPRPTNLGFAVATDTPPAEKATNDYFKESTSTPAIDARQAKVVHGQYFDMPVLPGWKQYEGKTDVVVTSPDTKSAYGVLGKPLAVGTTPEQFMKSVFEGFGVQDLQVVSTKNIGGQGGPEGIDATVTFTGADNVKRQGMIRSLVMTSKAGAFGMFLHAATPVDRFASDCKALCVLSSAIQMVPPPQQKAMERYNEAPVRNDYYIDNHAADNLR
jgi:hypothetical protein